jgi:hypothetical protein
MFVMKMGGVGVLLDFLSLLGLLFKYTRKTSTLIQQA